METTQDMAAKPLRIVREPRVYLVGRQETDPEALEKRPGARPQDAGEEPQALPALGAPADRVTTARRHGVAIRG